MRTTSQREVFAGGAIELRCGEYRDVLADVEACDAVITDPPYSDRTHDGARSANCFRNYDKRPDRIQNIIVYDRITAGWTQEWATFIVPRVRHWVVLFGDHVSNRWWESSLREADLQTFAPIPWVRTNAPPRFQGDGPQNSCEWIAVARPRGKVRDPGSRVGWYEGAVDARDQVVVGGKPLWLMRAIVRDYSRPGDLIVDPCAGGGTTLIAAALEGRRAIGAELDPATFEKACKRIAQTPITPPLFVDERPKLKQGVLL